MTARKLLSAVLLAFALLNGEASHARKNPSSIALDTGSATGVILVGLVPDRFDYQLVLQKEGDGGFGTRVYQINVEAERTSAETKFEARTLSSGRYVLKYVMQQKGWIACLEDQTYLITIKPGTVNYLGHVDVQPTLRTIQTAAIARGDLLAGGGSGGGIYYDGVIRPSIVNRDSGGLGAATNFVASIMTKTHAPTELAEIEDHSFRQPDDRNRRKRACN